MSQKTTVFVLCLVFHKENGTVWAILSVGVGKNALNAMHGEREVRRGKEPGEKVRLCNEHFILGSYSSLGITTHTCGLVPGSWAPSYSAS